jgi:hypothetical protein
MGLGEYVLPHKDVQPGSELWMRAWTLFARLCVLCACILSYSYLMHDSEQEPAFAADEEAGSDGSTRRLRRSGATPFYIYTGEGFDYSALLDCVPHWDTNQESQHAAEVWMYRQMLQHPLRTLDPSRARLFYVPVFLHLSYFARRCKGSSHAQRLQVTSNALHGSPFFQRNSGHDHTLVSNYWNISGASQPFLLPLLQNFSIGWFETCKSNPNCQHVGHVGR